MAYVTVRCITGSACPEHGIHERPHAVMLEGRRPSMWYDAPTGQRDADPWQAAHAICHAAAACMEVQSQAGMHASQCGASWAQHIKNKRSMSDGMQPCGTACSHACGTTLPTGQCGADHRVADGWQNMQVVGKKSPSQWHKKEGEAHGPTYRIRQHRVREGYERTNRSLPELTAAVVEAAAPGCPRSQAHARGTR
jgi:hypothetical protein